MVIVMKHGVTDEQINHVVDRLHELELGEHISRGEERILIGAVGVVQRDYPAIFMAMPGVENALRVSQTYKLASKESTDGKETIININGSGIRIGGKRVIIMAGPCAVENEDQIMTIAKAVKKDGAVILRGGAFKPRTGPYSFQGLELEGLKLLANAKKETGLQIVTEVMSVDSVDLVAKYADILQIGARNMQNFMLLKAVGQIRKPVLLKRGMSATIEELLNAAEYILTEGNHNVILCERGIRTFETSTRNSLDIGSIPVLKELTHLPVIVDPSHATGKASLVTAVSKAAIAAGADGLIIEVHNDPEVAVSDGAQSLLPEQFNSLMNDLKRIVEAVGRTFAPYDEEVAEKILQRGYSDLMN